MSRPRQSHCKRGHSLHDAPLNSKGGQVCRQCKALRARCYREGVPVPQPPAHRTAAETMRRVRFRLALPPAIREALARLPHHQDSLERRLASTCADGHSLRDAYIRLHNNDTSFSVECCECVRVRNERSRLLSLGVSSWSD